MFEKLTYVFQDKWTLKSFQKYQSFFSLPNLKKSKKISMYIIKQIMTFGDLCLE